MSFVAREEELAILDSQYKKKSSTFIAIYGRRRIGKTELINNFFA